MGWIIFNTITRRCNLSSNLILAITILLLIINLFILHGLISPQSFSIILLNLNMATLLWVILSRKWGLWPWVQDRMLLNRIIGTNHLNISTREGLDLLKYNISNRIKISSLQFRLQGTIIMIEMREVLRGMILVLWGWDWLRHKKKMIEERGWKVRDKLIRLINLWQIYKEKGFWMREKRTSLKRRVTQNRRTLLKLLSERDSRSREAIFFRK